MPPPGSQGTPPPPGVYGSPPSPTSRNVDQPPPPSQLFPPPLTGGHKTASLPLPLLLVKVLPVVLLPPPGIMLRELMINAQLLSSRLDLQGLVAPRHLARTVAERRPQALQPLPPSRTSVKGSCRRHLPPRATARRHPGLLLAQALRYPHPLQDPALATLHRRLALAAAHLRLAFLPRPLHLALAMHRHWRHRHHRSCSPATLDRRHPATARKLCRPQAARKLRRPQAAVRPHRRPALVTHPARRHPAHSTVKLAPRRRLPKRPRRASAACSPPRHLRRVWRRLQPPQRPHLHRPPAFLGPSRHQSLPGVCIGLPAGCTLISPVLASQHVARLERDSRSWVSPCPRLDAAFCRDRLDSRRRQPRTRSHRRRQESAMPLRHLLPGTVALTLASRHAPCGN